MLLLFLFLLAHAWVFLVSPQKSDLSSANQQSVEEIRNVLEGLRNAKGIRTTVKPPKATTPVVAAPDAAPTPSAAVIPSLSSSSSQPLPRSTAPLYEMGEMSSIAVNWTLAIHTRGAATPHCHWFGFFTEFLGLSSAFRKQLPNSRFIYAPCDDVFYSTMFPTEADNIKWLLRDTDVVNLKATSPSIKGGAVIYHGSSCGSFPKNRDNDDTIRIGRYIFEKDDYLQAKKRSPQKRDLDRIFNCCRKMDEVWVPTEWQREIFARHVPDSKIFVIPEAVDPTLFDPSISPSSPSKIFQFLSVFAWSYRKGWEILLDGYFHAFRSTDNVILRIRSNVPDFIGGDRNITARIEERKITFLNSYKGEYVNGFPAVIWEHTDGEIQSRESMRDLLGSANAFVLASRGEGWGLPVAEAMSMALPVVVPNHTGFTAYCNEKNSYLVAIDENRKDKIGFYKPDPLLLSVQLKKVKEDSEQLNKDEVSKAKKIGLQARADIVKLWSPEAVVSQITGRVNALYKKKFGTAPI